MEKGPMWTCSYRASRVIEMAEKQILPMCEVELKSYITALDFKTSTLTCTRYLWPKQSLDDTQINSHISSSSKLKIKLVFFLHVLLHKVLIFYSKHNFPSPHCCEEFNHLTFICPYIAIYNLCSFLFFFPGPKQVYGLIFVSYWLFSTFFPACPTGIFHSETCVRSFVITVKSIRTYLHNKFP